MDNRPVGRPRIVDELALQKLEEAWKLGCTDEEACLNADISRSTLHNYQKEHPELLDRKEELKEWPNWRARKTVVESLEKDPRMAIDYLGRKKKDEFAQRQEHTGKDGKDLPSIIGIEYVRPGDKDTTGAESETGQSMDTPTG